MLKDTRFRVIFLTIFVILLIIGLFVYFKFKGKETHLAGASLRGAPSVPSIPGSKEATTAYKEAVESENIRRAQEAARTGGSAVPTITQATYQGQQGFPGGTQGAQTPGCSPDDLGKARAAGVKPEELRCKGCTAEQLKVAGYSVGQLKEAGFTAGQLKEAGFDANQLRNAGYSAEELKKGGFTPGELKKAGFNVGVATPADLAKLPPNFPKDCKPESLKNAAANNISPQQIKQTLNCDVQALKNAGYTAAQLKKDGFTAGELKDIGLTPKELKEAGYTPAELRDAGLSAAQLREAGFKPEELKAGGYSRGDLLRAGFSPEQLKEVAESPLSENFPKDCNPDSLKRAFAANVPVSEIKRALGCNVASLKTAGYSPKQLKDGGFTAEELKRSGLTPQELKQAGFTKADMKGAGFADNELKDIPEEVAAGLATPIPGGAVELTKAGAGPAPIGAVELTKAGGVPVPAGGVPVPAGAVGVVKAGTAPVPVSPVDIAKPGFPKDCSVESLSNAKYFDIPVSQIRQVLKCDLAAFKAAGYTPTELIKAGFTPAALKNVGFNPTQLKAAGLNNADLVKAGFSPQEVQDTSNLLGDASDIAGQLPSIPPDRQAQFLSDLRKRQAEQLSDQQRQAAMQQIQQAMATQASDLLASWTPPPTQNFVLVPEEKVVVKKEETTTVVKEGAVLGNPKGRVIKAGSVLFGVLDTGINSDQDSPILATIVQGELKGARLVGGFTRKDEKVLVTFRTISIPAIKNSIGINAVAVDPDEVRTALASRVDNHYLLRYGTLFASSFLSGLSSAITQSGSTVSTNANTGIVVQNTPKLNSGQKALVALGNVGQQYASVLGKNFTVPPTVTVDAGIGIGVLLMQDLTIPENEQELDVLLTREQLKEKEQKKEERLDALERAEILRRGSREPRDLRDLRDQLVIQP